METMKAGIYLRTYMLFAILLILIIVPRFNHRHLLGDPVELSKNDVSLGDSRYYVAYTEYFRGERTTYQLKQPFTFRPMVPFLASLLPFKPMTAINVINIGMLLISLAFLMATIQTLGFSFPYVVVGCALFVISFPTFYYGTIGYVEPGVLALLFAGMYGLERKRWWVFFAAVVLGILAKETIVLLLPVLVTAAMTSPSDRKRLCWYTVVFIVIYIGGTVLVRVNAPGGGTYVWIPSWDHFINNVIRSHAWISPVLSYGLPALVIVAGVIGYGRKRSFRVVVWRYRCYVAGAAASLALFVYSITAAYADGRYMWLSYPFTVPLALAVLQYGNESIGRLKSQQ